MNKSMEIPRFKRLSNRGLWLVSGFVCLLLLVTASEVLAKTERYSGLVREVDVRSADNRVIHLKTTFGTYYFDIGAETEIQRVIKARDIQVGSKILVAGHSHDAMEGLDAIPEYDGRNKTDNALENMTEEKPPIPQSLPEVPELPEDVKDAKEDVMNRDPPNQPSPEDMEQMQQQQQQGQGQKQEKKPEEKPEIPVELNFPVPPPTVLSQMGSEDRLMMVARTVMERQESEGEITVNFEGGDEPPIVMKASDEVVQVVGLDAIEKDVFIQLEINRSDVKTNVTKAVITGKKLSGT